MDLLKLGSNWAVENDIEEYDKIWEYIFKLRKYLDRRPLLAHYFFRGTKDLTYKQKEYLIYRYPNLFDEEDIL